MQTTKLSNDARPLFLLKYTRSPVCINPWEIKVEMIYDADFNKSSLKCYIHKGFSLSLGTFLLDKVQNSLLTVLFDILKLQSHLVAYPRSICPPIKALDAQTETDIIFSWTLAENLITQSNLSAVWMPSISVRVIKRCRTLGETLEWGHSGWLMGLLQLSECEL